MVLNWFLKPEESLMLQTVSPLIFKLSLFLMTAVATHLGNYILDNGGNGLIVRA
jgi:hypothetical protein